MKVALTITRNSLDEVPTHGTYYTDIERLWLEDHENHIFIHNREQSIGYLIPIYVAIHWYSKHRIGEKQVRWKRLIEEPEYSNSIIRFSTAEQR